jgi:methylglyoxal reductase
MGSVALPVRTLGACGISSPALGIGCWPAGGADVNLGLPMGWDSGPEPEEAAEALTTAWQLGARLFDTADVYGHGRSERVLSTLVRTVPRDEIVLASKVGYFAGTAEHGFHPGHMRRQLEQSLENLQTDHLDIYFLHHADFGPADRWLDGACETMHRFRAEGLVRAVGMRGPHRFAPDRLTVPVEKRADKMARFTALFDRVRPDVLAVRDNLLTPAERSDDIYRFAAERHVGVLINKPLAQGLLTGVHDARSPRRYGPGDHRSRKRWFTADGLRLLNEGLDRLNDLVGDDRQTLISVALWACLARYRHAVVLVGFTSTAHVVENLTAAARRPADPVLATARRIMAEVRIRLDAHGEVFTDELLAASMSAR